MRLGEIINEVRRLEKKRPMSKKQIRKLYDIWLDTATGINEIEINPQLEKILIRGAVQAYLKRKYAINPIKTK